MTGYEPSSSGVGPFSVLQALNSSLKEVQLRDRTYAFFVLALTLLGTAIVSTSTDEETRRTTIIVVAIVVLAGSAITLALSLRDAREQRFWIVDYEPRQAAARLADGLWWQYVLVPSRDGGARLEAVTLLEIRLSGSVDAFDLSGRQYDSQGLFLAWWGATAVAIERLAPVRLFYRFEGHTYKCEDELVGPVMGIGEFHFEVGEKIRSANLGHGWFLTGQPTGEILSFANQRQVDLVRVKPGDRKILENAYTDEEIDNRRRLIASHFTSRDQLYRLGESAPHKRDRSSLDSDPSSGSPAVQTATDVLPAGASRSTSDASPTPP
ncbi:hypothetical protein [Geodermatophilus sp. CPCC 205761]|uniref:hypothetical protein n=1 Tax=Geodermatophilus sp. CPCC 205761 TaxID=2936597 RepID=UPI003EED883A